MGRYFRRIDGSSVAPIMAGFAALFFLSSLPVLSEVTQRGGVAVACVVLGSMLAVLCALDVRWFWLPDMLTIPLALAGLMFSLVLDAAGIGDRLIAMVAGFAALYVVGAAYEHLRGRPGLGLGDAKLLAAGGAWIGIEGLPAMLLIACITALLAIGVLALRGHALTATTRLPFGPFLAIGIWVVWLYGPFP